MSRPGVIRRNLNFRSLQRRARSHRSDVPERSHVALQRRRRSFKRRRIVAGERHLQFFAAVATPDIDARARNRHQFFAHLGFHHILLAALAARFHVDDQRRRVDFGIARSIRPISRTGRADRGKDMGDIRYLTKHPIGFPGRIFRIFECAPGRQRNRHLALPIVHGRHERGGQKRNQRQRSGEEGAGGQQCSGTVVQAGADPAEIAGHESAIVGFVRYRPHEVSRHHRRQQAGDQQRGQHRHRGGDAELFEDESGNPAHERRRQKHRHQGKGSRDHREADLVSRFHGGLIRRFRHLQVACDVFHFDDGVIDQNADDQRQRQQRHGIERIPQKFHREKGRDDG